MRPIAVALAVLLGATVLAACGGGSSSVHGSEHSGMDVSSEGMGGMHGNSGTMGAPTVPGAREVSVKGAALAFDPRTIQVRRGENVTIVLTATDLEHDFYVDGVGHVAHANRGETAKGGLRLDKRGTFRFWCTVTGHREAGMTGTITVT